MSQLKAIRQENSLTQGESESQLSVLFSLSVDWIIRERGLPYSVHKCTCYYYLKTPLSHSEKHFVTLQVMFDETFGYPMAHKINYHREPDIWEYEVKWALESVTANKASGGDGIPTELVQILKDAVAQVIHSICQQIWKTQQCPQDWKMLVFIPIPKNGDAKECSNYHIVAFTSHANKVMLNILLARLQQYINWELEGI